MKEIVLVYQSLYEISSFRSIARNCYYVYLTSYDLQMAPKKRPSDRWFKLAPDNIPEEHETPKEDTYVPKDDSIMRWSVQVVKAQQYKILLVLMVGTHESFTWTTVTSWEIASVQAMGDYVDIVLENSSLENAHVFMHQFTEAFDNGYVRDNCVDPDVVKPETFFLDDNITNSRVASRIQKMKLAINALNKTKQGKAKSNVTGRKQTAEQEGAGSSRIQLQRKPRSIPADSRVTPASEAAPAGTDSNMVTPSNSRQNTPSKRSRESSVTTDFHASPELQMPKPGQGVDAVEIQKIVTTFTTKCSDCFFMGREFKFDVNIAQCHLAPPEKCVRAKEDKYVEWIIAQIVGEQFKDDRQTIVVMPQGLTKMPTPEMWDNLKHGDFWLIDGQHSVEAAKKIQLMENWDDPYGQKEKLKVWKALVVWSDNMTRLSDISRYFNMGNKKRAYQASWIRNIMASREVWEFYERPPKERENAKDKNPKWEVSIVSGDRPKP